MSEREPCALLPWDTEFWGVRIGRVEGDVLTREKAASAAEWAHANDVACLTFLSGGDPASAHAAEEAGFRLMDVRVELTRPAAGASSGGTIRPFQAADLPALRAIARESHRATRFYADPRFPNERCDDLYDVWLTRSTEGLAQAVLVADPNGVAAGYVACHADERRGGGSIGLIAVAETARGQGLGAALVNAAAAWCADSGLEELSVVTQGRGVPALRLYERCGFTVASVGLWFHKWYA